MPDVIDKQQVIDQINALTVDGEFSQQDVNYLINYLLANGDFTGTPRDLIQIRRGNKADLPNLAQGELAFTLDSQELFVGGMDGSIQIGKVLTVDVKDFGAKGDGVDDTIAINKAIDRLNAQGGGVLTFPKGAYRITSSLKEITVPVMIEGAGRFNTFIMTSVSAATVFTIGSNFSRISDMEITYTGGTASTGSGILLKNSLHPTIERCNIHDFYINIDTVSAAYFTLSDNYLYNPVQYNVRVQHVADADGGDSKIVNNTFEAYGRPNMMAHIYQISSGGLRVIGNKMLHGKNGFVSQIADGALTSIVIIAANSIELQTESFIKIQRAGTTGRIPLVTITGNQLRSEAIIKGIMVADGTDTVAITGNILMGGIDNAGIAIEINNSAKDVNVAANVFRRWDTGILLNFTPASGTTGDNARATIGENQFADDVTYYYRNTGYIQDNAINARNEYTNNIVAADNVTYKNVFEIEIGTYSGGTLDVEMYGVIGSGGSFVRRISKLITREGAGITVGAVDDKNAGVAIDVNFDVTTKVGSVIVQVRKNLATGATLTGSAAISVRGDVTAFRAYNTV